MDKSSDLASSSNNCDNSKYSLNELIIIVCLNRQWKYYNQFCCYSQKILETTKISLHQQASLVMRRPRLTQYQPEMVLLREVGQNSVPRRKWAGLPR